MRNPEEIVQRIMDRENHDYFGFEISEYVARLSFSHAKQFLKPEVKEEEWKPNDDDLNKTISAYLPFAWEKANGCRGISAYRSILHFIAWFWLLGDPFHEEIQKEFYERYCYYGKPILIKISNHVGFDWTREDNGIRTNTDE